MTGSKKDILFLFITAFLVLQVCAKEQLSENLEMETKFYLESDQDTASFDYFDLGLDLDFLMDAPRAGK